jgi:hypothetical protein
MIKHPVAGRDYSFTVTSRGECQRFYTGDGKPNGREISELTMGAEVTIGENWVSARTRRDDDLTELMLESADVHTMKEHGVFGRWLYYRDAVRPEHLFRHYAYLVEDEPVVTLEFEMVARKEDEDFWMWLEALAEQFGMAIEEMDAYEGDDGHHRRHVALAKDITGFKQDVDVRLMIAEILVSVNEAGRTQNLNAIL